MVGAHALAAQLHDRLATLTDEIARESELRTLPLRSLVAVQAGAAFLALAAGVP